MIYDFDNEIQNHHTSVFEHFGNIFSMLYRVLCLNQF